MKNLLLLFLLLPIAVVAQKSKKDSIWLPLKQMAGKWTGNGTGQSGDGKYERTYQFILGNNFLECRNKSTYSPSKTSQKGEVHEDVGYFSYDKKSKTFKLRQFHVEGFVNEFKLDSISPDRKTIVFLTESIENIPTGFRAKETYHFITENEFEEVFEIAEPNKAFELYSKVRLRRR